MKNSKVLAGVFAFALAGVLVTVFQNCQDGFSARNARDLSSLIASLDSTVITTPDTPTGSKVYLFDDFSLSESQMPSSSDNASPVLGKAGGININTKRWPLSRLHFAKNPWIRWGEYKDPNDHTKGKFPEYSTVIGAVMTACQKWSQVAEIECFDEGAVQSSTAADGQRLIWVSLAQTQLRNPTTLALNGNYFCGRIDQSVTPNSCASIGYLETGDNYIAINEEYINNEYNVTHEVGHLIGLSHTHSREDRDEYLEFNSKFPTNASQLTGASVGFTGFSNYVVIPDIKGNGDSFDWASIMLYKVSGNRDEAFLNFVLDYDHLRDGGVFAIRNQYFEQAYAASKSSRLAGFPSPKDAAAAIEMTTGRKPVGHSDCTFNGRSIPHGTRIGVYATGHATVAGDYCATQARVCTEGTLSTGSSYETCDARCLVEGSTRTFKLGEEIRYFDKPTVAANETCVEKVMYCDQTIAPKTGSTGKPGMLGKTLRGIYLTCAPVGQPPVVAPETNDLPKGYVDSVSAVSIEGWAYDPTPGEQSKSISVQIVADNPLRSMTYAGTPGTIIGNVTANIPRPDVNTAMSITGNHKFLYAINSSTETLSGRMVYIYAKDSTAVPEAWALIGSGQVPRPIEAPVDCAGTWSACTNAMACGTSPGTRRFTATQLTVGRGQTCDQLYGIGALGTRLNIADPPVACTPSLPPCSTGENKCIVTAEEKTFLDVGPCEKGGGTAVQRTDPTSFTWTCPGTGGYIDHCTQKKLTCAAGQTRNGAGTAASPYVCITAGVPSCTLSYAIKNSAGVDISAGNLVPWLGTLTESIQCSSLRANSTVQLFSFKDDVEQAGTPFTITLNAAGAFAATVTNDKAEMAGSWVRYLTVSDANGEYINTEANKKQVTVAAAPTYVVKGFVEPAVYEGPVGARTKITIRGWACMRSDTVQVNTPMDVHMWLGAKSIAEGGRVFLLRTDINLTPGPDGNAVAAECNSINTAPKRFEIAMTGTEFNNAKGKRVYFFGVPGPSSISPAELTNSGFLIESNTAGGPPACTLSYTGLNAAKHLPWNASGSENIQCSNLAGNTVMLYSETNGNPQEGFPVTVTLSASGGSNYPFTNNDPALAGSYVRHVEFLDASSNYVSTPDQTIWIDPQPSYSVKGVIDQPVYFGAVGARTGVDIGGWACRRSDSEQVNEPISVHLYFGAKPGQAGAIGPIVLTANIAVSGSDGAAINSASNCNSTDVRKRFVFSIRNTDFANAKGKRVFIYGVPGTISPAELGNSGTYTVESDAAAGPPSCALSYTGLNASRHLAWGATATEKIECHNLRPGSTVELFSTKDGASEDGSPFQVDLNASGVYTRSIQNNDAIKVGSYARYVRVTDALDQIYITTPDPVPTYPDFTFIVDPGATYTVKGVVDAVIPIAGSGGTSTGVRVQGWACLRSSTAEATAPIDVHLYFDSVGPMVTTANLAVSGSDAAAINSSSNCNSTSTLKRFSFEVTESTAIKYSAVRGKKVNVYAIYAPQNNPRLGGTNFWAEDGSCTLSYSNINGGTLYHGETTTESIQCSNLRAGSVVKLYSKIDGTTQANTPFTITLDASGKFSSNFTNNVDALYGKTIERFVEVSVGGAPYFTGTPISVYIQGQQPIN